jgi:hypothetical protein
MVRESALGMLLCEKSKDCGLGNDECLMLFGMRVFALYAALKSNWLKP